MSRATSVRPTTTIWHGRAGVDLAKALVDQQMNAGLARFLLFRSNQLHGC